MSKKWDSSIDHQVTSPSLLTLFKHLRTEETSESLKSLSNLINCEMFSQVFSFSVSQLLQSFVTTVPAFFKPVAGIKLNDIILKKYEISYFQHLMSSLYNFLLKNGFQYFAAHTGLHIIL